MFFGLLVWVGVGGCCSNWFCSLLVCLVYFGWVWFGCAGLMPGCIAFRFGCLALVCLE